MDDKMDDASCGVVERFISQFESGEQGCSMDCDDAKGFAEDLRSLLDERDALAWQRNHWQRWCGINADLAKRMHARLEVAEARVAELEGETIK